MEQSKPKLQITVHNGKQKQSIPLENILRDYFSDTAPEYISLDLVRDDCIITATTDPKEADYPGIMLDAYDKDGDQLYIGNVEMPNETYPSRIAARLYAGYAKFEVDAPIALITHDIKDTKAFLKYEEDFLHLNRQPIKQVYIDRENAHVENWAGQGEETLKEHLPDAYIQGR